MSQSDLRGRNGPECVKKFGRSEQKAAKAYIAQKKIINNELILTVNKLKKYTSCGHCCLLFNYQHKSNKNNSRISRKFQSFNKYELIVM